MIYMIYVTCPMCATVMKQDVRLVFQIANVNVRTTSRNERH